MFLSGFVIAEPAPYELFMALIILLVLTFAPGVDSVDLSAIRVEVPQHSDDDFTIQIKTTTTEYDDDGVDPLVDTYETKLGPRNGARVVARAWTDPAYLQRLRDDASAAIAELGYGGMQGEHSGGRRKCPSGSQRGGVHAVLLLSLASARVAAGLVQVECLPLPGSDRSAQRIEGVRGRAG